MFSVLLFVFLPVVFLLHDAEEMAMRARCLPGIVERVSERFPRFVPLAERLRDIGGLRFAVIVAEEAVLLVVALVLFLNGFVWVLAALFWGFGAHLLVHVVQALALGRYVPGLVTAVLLVPYFVLGASDLLLRYGWGMNGLLAAAGGLAVGANLLVMHKMMGK